MSEFLEFFIKGKELFSKRTDQMFEEHPESSSLGKLLFEKVIIRLFYSFRI
jgi:hypothetical protein